MFQEILEYSVKKDNINPTSYSTTGCLPSRINYLILVYAIIDFKSFLRLIQFYYPNLFEKRGYKSIEYSHGSEWIHYLAKITVFWAKQYIFLLCFLHDTPYFDSFNMSNLSFRCSVGCLYEKIGQGRSFSSDDVLISDCCFLRSSLFTGDGGVIYVNGGSFSLNINLSIFYFCSCSSEGGAIFFSSPYSFLNHICASSCFASGNYHFAYLFGYHTNRIDYLSISLCSSLERRAT